MINFLRAITKRMNSSSFRRTLSSNRRKPLPPRSVWSERLEDRALLAAVSWDGGAGTLNWADAANWSANVLPTSVDDVTIDIAGTNTVTSAGSVSIKSLTSNEIVSVTGSSWTLGGNLSGAGTLRTAGGTVNLNGANWTNTSAIDVTSGILNLGGSFTTAGVGALTRTSGTAGTVNVTGTLTNTASTLMLDTASNGYGSWFFSGTIVGGTVQGSNGAVLNASNGGTLNGVTIAAGTDLVSNTTVNILNGLTVNGRYLISAGPQFFNGTQTLGGSGEVKFSTGGFLDLNQNNMTLTVGPSLLIHGGTGNISNSNNRSNVTLINQGTIAADASGTLTIGGNTFNFTNNGSLLVTSASGTLTVGTTATTTWANAGSINVTAGTLNLGGAFTTAGVGTLTRTSGTAGTVNVTGTLTNTASTLALDTASNGYGSWFFSGTIVGGTVQGSNGAVLNASNGGTLNGVTIAAGTDLVSNTTVNIVNGLTVNGRYLVSAGPQFFNGTQTLGGSGEVKFSTGGFLDLNQNNMTLTVGPSLLIHGGTGNISNSNNRSNVTLINQGTIAADASGTLTIGGNTFNFTNNGALLVTNGTGTLTVGTTATTTWANTGTINVTAGTLNLGGMFTTAGVGALTRTSGTAGTVNVTGTLTNTASTLALDTASNGYGSWFFSGTIVGGTVQGSNGAVLNASNGGTLNGVTIAAGTDLVSNTTVNIVNGLTVNGRYLISAGPQFFNGTQTLGGSGEVKFSTGGFLDLNQANMTLTVGPNLLIHGGTGNISNSNNRSNVSLINQGTIAADASGTLTIGGNTFNFTNNGSLLVTNASGTLTVGTTATTTWANAGTINVTAGTLNLGGAFTTAGVGTLTRTSGTAGTVNVTGTLTNTASTLMLNTASNGYGSWFFSGTIVGGTVQGSNGAVLNASNGGTLNGVTIAAGTDLVSNTTVNIVNGLTVNGRYLISAGPQFFNGTQTLGGSGEVKFSTGGFLDLNQANMTLTVGPNLLIHGGTGNISNSNNRSNVSLVNQGTIAVDTNNTLTIGGNTFTFTNTGIVSASGGGTLVATSPLITNLAGNTLTGGTWRVFANSTLRLPSAINTNAATILLDGANSNVYVGGSGTTNALAGLVTNAAAGSFTIANGRSYLPPADFTNAGAVTIGTGSSFGVGTPRAYTQTSGATTVNGTLTGTAVAVQAGTLQGNGTISTNVTNGGTVQPGGSSGTLTIAGNYTQTGAGAIQIEFGGLTAGTQYDQLVVSGTVSLDGNLLGSLINSYVPALGTTYTILNNTGAGAIAGTFAGQPQGSFVILGGESFQIDYLGGTGNDIVLNRLNQNFAPTSITFQNTTTSLPEDTSTAAAIRVADIVVADDGQGINQLSLTGADAARFQIVGTELRLRAGVTLDFETQATYLVTVNVNDQTVGGNPDASANFTLSLTDVNDPPTGVAFLNATTSLPENTSTAAAIKLADISVIDDAIPAAAIVLSLSGADAARFELVGSALFLRAGVTLNFEAQAAYLVTVHADDPAVGGAPDSATNFTLTLTDVNEAPTALAFQNSVTSLPEGSSTPRRVADLVVIDDALGAYTFSLSGADAARFEVIGNELRIKAGVTLDFETQPTYSVTVSADDSGLEPDVSNVFTLNLTNVNEAPTLTSPLADQTTFDNLGFNFTVPGNTFTDPDAGNVLTYSASLSNGNPLPSWLTFSPATRTFNGIPRTADIGSYSIRVTARDAGNLAAFDDFQITVIRSIFLSISDASVAEGNAGLATASFTVSLGEASARVVTVNWQTTLGGTASASDLQNPASQGTVTFQPGETSQPITVSVVGDTLMERHETFQVLLTNPTNAVIYDNFGQATIVDEDVEAIYTTPTGPLDVTWSQDGLDRQRPVDTASRGATAVDVDSDGRVLVFGDGITGYVPTNLTGEVFAALRYNPNGTLDNTFSGDGSVSLTRADLAAAYPAVSIVNSSPIIGTTGAVYKTGPDRGKVLIAGIGTIYFGAAFQGRGFVIARLNVDGSLDSSFGTNGFVTLPPGPGTISGDRPASIAIYESGANAGKFIVVGGNNVGSGGVSLSASRHNADGSLDTSFDSDGKLNFQLSYVGIDSFGGLGYVDGNRVLIDYSNNSTGQILIAGRAGIPGVYSGAEGTRVSGGILLRLNDNGGLDPTFQDGFGMPGVVFAPPVAYGSAAQIAAGNMQRPGELQDIAWQPDGKIVATGVISVTGYVARFDSNGAVDTTFNGTGARLGFLGNIPGATRNVVVTADGKILVNTSAEISSVAVGLGVQRLNSNGTPDTTFDSTELVRDGFVPFQFGPSDIGAESALTPDGNMVVVGSTFDNATNLARFTTAKYETARSDLSVTMSGPTSTTGGSTISYTITVRNTGDDAVFASLRDVLPTGLTFVSLTTPSGWAYSAPAVGSNGTVIAAIRNLRAADGDQVFTLTVVVDAAVFAVQEIINTATVSSAILDYNAANSTASFTVNPPCIEAPAGLVAWLRAENNPLDAVPALGFNDGTLLNGATFDTGRVGQTFQLDGVDDAVSVGSLNLGTSFTVEAWINPESVFGFGSQQHLIANDAAFSANPKFGSLYFQDNRLGYLQGGGFQVGTAANSVPVNVWTHIALTYDGNTTSGGDRRTRIYINGVLSGTSSAHTESFNNPLQLGYAVVPTVGHFHGQIDEVSLYNRALTANELLAIAQYARGGGKCVNEIPVADNDAYTVAEDGSLIVAAPGVLDGDTDLDLDTLTAILVNGPTNGTLILNANGSFQYTPTPNFHGTDTFTYQASDDHDLSATATVTIVVTEVNDAPTAGADTATVAEDGSVTITVLTNDSTGPANESGQSLSITAASALHGSVIINANGTLSYSPAANYNGSDTISYTIQDNGTTNSVADPLTATGSVSVTVTEVNDAPTAGADTATVAEDGSVTITVLTNDSTGPANESGQSLTITAAWALHGSVIINANGTLSYSPAANYNGPDTINYTVQDNGTTNGVANPLTATGSVSVTVSAVNDAPSVANNGNVSANEGASATNTGTWSDLDLDVVTLAASVGSLTKNANGTWSWSFVTNGSTPSQAVTITATDSDGAATTTIFQLVVSSVNNAAPVITAISNSSPDCGGAFQGESVSVLASFTDANAGDSHTATINWGDGTTSVGSITEVNGSGSVTGSHVYAAGGFYTITVSVSDGGLSDVETTSNVISGVGLHGGVLYIIGTDGKDVIHVNATRGDRLDVHANFDVGRRSRGNYNDETNDDDWSDDDSDDDAHRGSERYRFLLADVTRIEMQLCNGDDLGHVTRRVHINALIDGEEGDDKLRGGGGNDTVLGGTGDDKLWAATGNDFIDGGDGNDKLFGGQGCDTLLGGQGNDQIKADGGADSINGGDGNDDIFAGKGHDTIDGGAGDDEIHEGSGSSVIYGGSGNDTIRAGKDGDVIDGGTGDDMIYGGQGADLIIGGDGNDGIRAGSGNDTVFAGAGNDDVDGGNGDDYLDLGADNDSADGGNGNDIVLGRNGHDTITGSQGRDLLIGGVGADKLTGNSDEDVLIAGDTSYDGNQAALVAIMAEWSSNKTYAARVSNLLNGTGLTGGNKLNGNDGATQTVFADADIDTLSGSQGTDLFWANLVADNGGAIDVLMDKASNETANDSDL